MAIKNSETMDTSEDCNAKALETREAGKHINGGDSKEKP
jgi:hypothetical protein